MHLTHAPMRQAPSRQIRFQKPVVKPAAAVETPTYAVDEINAYMAVQEIALAEAEKAMTSENVERARIANELVENCLRPARPVYAAQHLPETIAIAARKRCEEVKVRVALFRVYLASTSRHQAQAA